MFFACATHTIWSCMTSHKAFLHAASIVALLLIINHSVFAARDPWIADAVSEPGPLPSSTASAVRYLLQEVTPGNYLPAPVAASSDSPSLPLPLSTPPPPSPATTSTALATNSCAAITSPSPDTIQAITPGNKQALVTLEASDASGICGNGSWYLYQWSVRNILTGTSSSSGAPSAGSRIVKVPLGPGWYIVQLGVAAVGGTAGAVVSANFSIIHVVDVAADNAAVTAPHGVIAIGACRDGSAADDINAAFQGFVGSIVPSVVLTADARTGSARVCADASNSSAAAGRNLTAISWQLRAASEEGAGGSSGSAERFASAPLVPGSYYLVLTVQDDAGSESSTAVLVRVLLSAPTPPALQPPPSSPPASPPVHEDAAEPQQQQQPPPSSSPSPAAQVVWSPSPAPVQPSPQPLQLTKPPPLPVDFSPSALDAPQPPVAPSTPRTPDEQTGQDSTLAPAAIQQQPPSTRQPPPRPLADQPPAPTEQPPVSTNATAPSPPAPAPSQVPSAVISSPPEGALFLLPQRGGNYNLTLEGRLSTPASPQAPITQYKWTLRGQQLMSGSSSGPWMEPQALEGGSVAVTLPAGVYFVELQVSDAEGRQGTASTGFSVVKAPTSNTP